MKSKITKIQILTKGIAIFIIVILMLSSLSILNVFAAEMSDDSSVSDGTGTEDESGGTDYIGSEDSEYATGTIIKEIDKLKNQLAELNAALNGNFTYEDFTKKIASNTTIEISTELELRALSIYVEEGNNCSGKTFKLTNNIVLTDTLEWSPIGNNTNQFRGTIDGSGYTISGMLISIKQSYAGLVGYLGSGGAIKNLTISNSNISIPPEVDNKIINDLLDVDTVSYSYLGAFAGYAIDSTITNCRNTTNVSGGNIVGGIVGRMKNGSITYCSNSGYIQAYRTAGGIVGSFDVMTSNKSAQYKISKCQNKGSVYAILINAGGIAGTLWNNSIISYCLNDGEVSTATAPFKVYVKAEESSELAPENVGGIVGVASSCVIEGTINTTESNLAIPTIEYCLNDVNAKINGYKDIGGIAGQLGGYNIPKEVGNAKILVNMNYCINNSAFKIDDYRDKKNVGELAGRAGVKDSMGTIFKNCSYLNYEKKDNISAHKTTTDKILAFGFDGFIYVYVKDGKYNESMTFKKTAGEDIAKIKDTTAPKVDDTIKATIVNDGDSQDFAIKGNVVKIAIPFDEPINVNRIYPQLSLISQNIKADYVGIDGKNLIFKYTITGNEKPSATLPYAIDNLQLTGTMYDIFGNKRSYSSQILSVGKTGANLKIVNSNLESIKNASVTYSKDKIVYTISGFSNITEDGKLYFNKNSTMKVTASLAGKLTHSGNINENLESDIPKLQIKTDTNSSLFKNIEGTYNTTNYALTYNVGLSESASVSVKELYLTTQNEIYISGENVGRLSEANTLVNVKNIIIDTVAPELAITTSVNNETESGRYTVGEDILIKATTNEIIDLEKSILPEINVSFSESGLGKYNTQGENAKTGNAKYMETIENENGSITLKYRYTIQEGDEGLLQLNYANNNGIITDIAGNKTTLEAYPKNNTNDAMTQEDLNENKINGKETTVSYEIYKGNNKITNFKNNTYFSNGDTIKIKAIFSNPLYSSYGSSNTKVNRETAPKLKVNNIEFNIESVSTDAKTITYYYTINGNSNEQLKDIALRTGPNVYAKKVDNTYETISGNFAGLNILNCNLYIHNNSTVFNESTIYADTTAPAVKIIPNCSKYDFDGDGYVNQNDVTLLHEYIVEMVTNNQVARNIKQNGDINGDGKINIDDATELGRTLKNGIDITNTDKIIYNFIWSEEVTGFTADDITVNGGKKGVLSEPKDNGDGTYSYTMTITNSVASGNTGNIQVIIEKGACKDLVGHENIRTENIITVDKKAPVLEDYTIYQSDNKKQIIVEAIFDEAISYAGSSSLDIRIGENNYAGTLDIPEILEPSNKVKYIYNISGADGGKVDITLSGTVKDIAGNSSEKLNTSIENDIVLEKTVIKTEDAEYSFRKNKTNITDFANPTYFKENDKIYVTKTTEAESKTYVCTIVPTYNDNTHMRYMTLTEASEGQTQGTAEFTTISSTRSINITDANFYFDTTSPIVTTQVTANNPKSGLYTTEEEFTIIATSSEVIQSLDNIPEIAVRFDGKTGIFNNGKAQYVGTRTNENGTTSWVYRYVVSEGDEGKISLSYVNSLRIIDLAGNSTILTSLNSNGNIFELNGIQVDATAPTVKITANNFKYDFNNDGYVDAKDVKLLQEYIDDVITNSQIKANIEQNGDVDCDGEISVNDATELQRILEYGINITNEDTIKYTFTWSEAVIGFTVDDITVNNGTKGILSGPQDNGDGTYSYTMDITNSVASGNTGNIQVIIEKGACQDTVGHENVRTESVITVDKKAPTVEIVADKDYVKIGETINYTFNWSEAVTGFTASDITVNNATKGEFNKVSEEQYTLQVTPTNGNDVEVIVDNNKCTDIAKNNNIGNKHIIAVAPTVKISTNKNNPTNASEITYTFEWSESITGFTIDDIIVPEKAIKGDLVTKKGANNTYTMVVDYNNVIPTGNQGEVTVAIKENAVQDVNGNENAYTSNTTKIDRIAPILISLEAYTTSNITVAEDVDSVKEFYRVGDKVTIVATFSENIESTIEEPTLALQFSESGTAKGTVSVGTIDGNKITYTYTITEGDMGNLSVKGFSGTVIDVAGNETIVTKRNLDGDTIIADTLAPKLVGLTAIVSDFEYDELLEDPEDSKRYGITSKKRENNTITVIAEYSENVYKLQSNTVNNITKDTAPVLKLRFGIGTTKTATFDKIENNKIYYTYVITTGDNGKLSITSLSGTISDIAGNTYTTDKTLPELDKYEESISDENKVDNITADTTNPIFTITATAIDKDDNGNKITGNGMYYRKGSIITVTAKTNEYVYKNNNKELTRFAENGSDSPELNISFSTSGNGIGTCTNVEYKNNQTILTYTYTIKANDNGTLNLNIAASKVYDIALNGNNVKTQVVSGIIADTVNPVTNWQSWVESEQYGIVDNMNGTWTVTFNEAIYVYNPNTHTIGSRLSNSNKSLAPVLLVSNDNTTSLETTIENITTTNNKTVITYTYSPYTKNLGAYGMKFASVSDCAGNLFNYKDQVAPTLTSIKVTNPVTGRYKAGEEITILATFSEKITGTAPVLKLKFGDIVAKGTVSSGVIDENTITYTYTITDGDNGILSIESYTGTGLTDFYDNVWVAPTSVTLSGNKITADTIAPTLTITSNVEKTNADKVIYTFTWSESVTGFAKDDIEVTNGSKGEFAKVNSKTYTLEVDTIEEGRQIIKVASGVCTDLAGNENEQRVLYNKVIIDLTKPTIRARVNGGNYVIDTDSKRSTLKEILVVNEEVSKFEYIWSDSTTIPSSGWSTINSSDIEINSDIPFTTKVDNTGTYYLYMKVTDLAGNSFEGRTKGFVVKKSAITFTPSTTAATNQDVTVTVSFGDGLTQNRKAGVQGKTQSADSTKVIIGENGTIYAEASDIVGNKVYNTLEVTNIDKIAPEATIDYTTNEDGTVTATITFNEDATVTNNEGKTTYIFKENGEFIFEFVDRVGNKGTATAKVTTIKEKEPEEPDIPPVEEDKTAPEITFNYTTTTVTVGTTIGATITSNEDAIISYSWDNINWTSSSDYTRSINAKKNTTIAGTYTLYAKATDKASNTSAVSTLKFTVLNSDDDIVKPEVIFEDLTTIQKEGVKYVKVSPTFTTANLTAKMNKDALLGKTPKYTKLTSNSKLKTGSEITIDGDTKYIVIVNGDVNCDGKVDFLNDILMINNYRIGINKNLKDIQILAGDINNSGDIEFIPDIVAINNYRLGRIKVL